MTDLTAADKSNMIKASIEKTLAAIEAEKVAGYPMAKEYLKQVLPTYIESWPAALCSLSIAQVDVPLTLPQANSLGSHIIELGEAFDPGPIDDIISTVNQAVQKFPNGAFVRLGSRSPKDSWLAGREGSMRVVTITGEITAANSPLRFILDCSERMYEDLTLAVHSNYEPHIFVRQWINLEKWQEFRCFMRGRRLVGISQYYYRDGAMPEIIQNAELIRWAIDVFFNDFQCESHLDDVVFDVFVTKKTSGNENVWEVKLLEINPFFEMTDPCLFDWRNNGKSLDGSFKYHKA